MVKLQLAIEVQTISASLIIFLSFDESSHELKVARVYRFQNNRSSAETHSYGYEEASVGYLLFWIIYTCYLEANDKMRIMTRKMMGRERYVCKNKKDLAEKRGLPFCMPEGYPADSSTEVAFD